MERSGSSGRRVGTASVNTVRWGPLRVASCCSRTRRRRASRSRGWPRSGASGRSRSCSRRSGAGLPEDGLCLHGRGSVPVQDCRRRRGEFLYDQTAVPEKALSSVGSTTADAGPVLRRRRPGSHRRRHDCRPLGTAGLESGPRRPVPRRQGDGPGSRFAELPADFLHHQTTYRYIHSPKGGCEVTEGSVEGTGWRRLVQYGTSDENVGERQPRSAVSTTRSAVIPTISIGITSVFSPCHHHFHFNY